MTLRALFVLIVMIAPLGACEDQEACVERCRRQLDEIWDECEDRSPDDDDCYMRDSGIYKECFEICAT